MVKRAGLGTISRSSGIVRFVQGGVVKTFRYAAQMQLTFLLLLVAFLAHEIDAYHKSEWRLLYFFRSMPDNAARQAFAYAHIPLVVAIIWLGYWGSAPVVGITRMCLAIFAIVHAFLHFRLRNHPQYEFNAFSHLLIVMTAVFGGIYLLLVARSAA